MDKSAGVPARYATAHKSPKGAGDARPSAEQVLQDEGLIDKFQGKTILITGGKNKLYPCDQQAFTLVPQGPYG